MRKTVIDGSNTSGFQRTVMIARDGFIETNQGKVKIEGLFLEEDSARPMIRDGKNIIYRLDRLGIPLLEIATAPDIKTPEQAKEVALHIGDILRSCRVKRGIGTIRQDINISIKGSNRVELKGFQDPKIMVKTVENEISRQQDFLKKRMNNPSEVRNVLPDGTSKFLRPMPGEARMYPETDLLLLNIHRNLINEIKRNLPKLRSEVLEDLKKTGLNHEMIKLLIRQNKFEEFKEFLRILDNPQLIAKILLIFPKEIASREKISINKIGKILNKEVLVYVLENLKRKKISEDQLKQSLERIVKGEKIEKAIVFDKEDINVVEEKIIEIIKRKQGLSLNAYMGLVMKEFHGKIDGKEVMEIMKKYVE
jgi:Glu-tRNA(Gln) amidotransferase subunit E-like FAD-binding protein